MQNNTEERLINLSVKLIDECGFLESSYAGQNLYKQVLRSSSSAALNYGEAMVGQSRRDFIHKISISLKELRETKTNLMIIQRSKLKNPITESLLNESDELVAILFSSRKTSREKLEKEGK